MSYGHDAYQVDPSRPEVVVINQTNLDDAIRIQEHIRDTVLAGENARASYVQYFQADAINYYAKFYNDGIPLALTDHWLFGLMSGWPIATALEGQTLDEDATIDIHDHDRTTSHGATLLYSPREIQEHLTDAIVYAIDDRRQFRAGKAEETSFRLEGVPVINFHTGTGNERVTSSQNGVNIIEENTDSNWYLNLLAALVQADDVDTAFDLVPTPEELKRYFDETGIGNSAVHVAHKVANPHLGLKLADRKFTRLIVYNYRHEHGANPDEAYVLGEISKFHTGIKRVAHKIRGDYDWSQDTPPLAA